MGSPKGLDYVSLAYASLSLLLEQFSQLRDVRAEQLHLRFVECHPTALVLGLEQGFDRRDVSECVGCRRGWRRLARGSPQWLAGMWVQSAVRSVQQAWSAPALAHPELPRPRLLRPRPRRVQTPRGSSASPPVSRALPDPASCCYRSCRRHPPCRKPARHRCRVREAQSGLLTPSRKLPASCSVS